MANRTALFSRHQPGGVFTIEDVVDHPGNIWFVDSGAAGASDGAGYGRNPDAPFATLGYAFSSDLVESGDVVYVMPGHAQTVSTAITMDIAGVKVIGLGHGTIRPALTGAAVIDVITVTAANVSIENLRFVTPSAAVDSLINIAAANVRVANCRFELGANIVDAVTITAAGELPIFEDNEVIVAADGPDSWLKFEGVVDRPIIRNNYVIGSDGTDAFDDGVFDFGSQAVTNPMVYDNLFDGADQTCAVFANVASVVGDHFGPNAYSGSATDGDTVTTVTAGAFIPSLGYRVSKTEDLNPTADDLFTVTGKVLVTAIFGEVTNAIGAGVTDYQLRIKTDNTVLCAASNIASNAIGSMLLLNGDVSVALSEGALTAVDNGGKGLANRLVGKAGGTCTIESTHSAGDAGDAIIWTLYYMPLEASAAVTAAA